MRLIDQKIYTLEVSHNEMLLISKALGGRLRNEEEVEAAKNLDHVIATQRIQTAEHDYREIQKLKQNMNK